MNNKTLYLTLVASAALGFLFTLALYASWSPNRVSSRLAFGIFVSVLPALGALLVLKLTNIFVTWRGAFFVYFVLFVLVVIIQGFGRMIPVHG